MAKEKIPAPTVVKQPIVAPSELTVMLREPIDVNVFLPDGSVVEFRAGKATVTPETAENLKKAGV